MLPLATLAELRLRQGQIEEAAPLLEGLDDDAAALAQRVRLSLQRGEPDARAARCSTGVGRGCASRRHSSLEAELALAAGDGEAPRAAERLAALAAALDRDDLAPRRRIAGGPCRGRRRRPRPSAPSRSCDRLRALGFPLEEGRARLALAGVLAAAGSPRAVDTARRARDAFEALGARADADRAAALLRELGGSGRTSARVDARRADGARDGGAPAARAKGSRTPRSRARLVISPKTAEHHVSRVLAKLGVRTRAEAAAHAVREGSASRVSRSRSR